MCHVKLGKCIVHVTVGKSDFKILHAATHQTSSEFTVRVPFTTKIHRQDKCMFPTRIPTRAWVPSGIEPESMTFGLS